MARPREIAITSEAVEILDDKAAHDRFKRHLSSRPNLKKLQEEAQRRGFQPLDTAEESFAIRVTAKASGQVRPKPGARGKGVQAVEFELVGQSFSNGNDQAAVLTTTIKAGDQEETYEAFLEAPGGDFRRAREYTMEGAKVVETQSWWTAWVGCLRGRCASTCLSALVRCSGTWTAYFWCVVARCGGCVLRCAACATCDCSWWCRWAAGCCDR